MASNDKTSERTKCLAMLRKRKQRDRDSENVAERPRLNSELPNNGPSTSSETPGLGRSQDIQSHFSPPEVVWPGLLIK